MLRALVLALLFTIVTGSVIQSDDIHTDDAKETEDTQKVSDTSQDDAGEDEDAEADFWTLPAEWEDDDVQKESHHGGKDNVKAKATKDRKVGIQENNDADRDVMDETEVENKEKNHKEDDEEDVSKKPKRKPTRKATETKKKQDDRLTEKKQQKKADDRKDIVEGDDEEDAPRATLKPTKKATEKKQLQDDHDRLTEKKEQKKTDDVDDEEDAPKAKRTPTRKATEKKKVQGEHDRLTERKVQKKTDDLTDAEAGGDEEDAPKKPKRKPSRKATEKIEVQDNHLAVDKVQKKADDQKNANKKKRGSITILTEDEEKPDKGADEDVEEKGEEKDGATEEESVTGTTSDDKLTVDAHEKSNVEKENKLETPRLAKVAAAEDDKKKDEKKKKPKKMESAGISPAEKKELDDLKHKIIDEKKGLKEQGMSGGQMNTENTHTEDKNAPPVRRMLKKTQAADVDKPIRRDHVERKDAGENPLKHLENLRTQQWKPHKVVGNTPRGENGYLDQSGEWHPKAMIH